MCVCVCVFVYIYRYMCVRVCVCVCVRILGIGPFRPLICRRKRRESGEEIWSRVPAQRRK